MLHEVRCTAETIALLDGLETALYMKEIFKELAVEVYTNNQSLLDALKQSKYVNEKRL